MLSSKPYLFSALYEWILDSDCTPHIVVDATLPGVEVPNQHVRNGQIVLNISPSAITGWLMTKQTLAFSARFGGVSTAITVPMAAILGIYARENGQGMMFGPEDASGPEHEPPSGENGGRPAPGSGKPSLRVVK